jgi:hypothetical protein
LASNAKILNSEIDLYKLVNKLQDLICSEDPFYRFECSSEDFHFLEHLHDKKAPIFINDYINYLKNFDLKIDFGNENI